MPQDESARESGAAGVDNSVVEKIGAPKPTIRLRVATADSWFELRPELVQALVAEYPTVDVRRQIAKMLLWCEANEARRWRRPMAGIKRWLDKEAKREAKRSAVRAPRGTRAARATRDVLPWWKTTAGWAEQGELHGVLTRDGELFLEYRARVCIALGEGPWIDDRDWALLRAIERLRGEQVVEREQAREHIARLRDMGLLRGGAVH